MSTGELCVQRIFGTATGWTGRYSITQRRRPFTGRAERLRQQEAAMQWKKLWQAERTAMDYVGKFADLVVLSVLWLICSFPLITIIPASAALYYAAAKSVRRDCGRATAAFFQSFRANLLQGIPMSILTGLIFVAGTASARAADHMDTAASMWSFLAAAVRILLVLLIALILYLAPVLSRFAKSTGAMLCFSFLLTFRHWWVTLVLLCLAGLCAAAIWFSLILVIVLPGIYALLRSFVVEPLFRQYLQPPPDGLPPAQLPWYWK